MDKLRYRYEKSRTILGGNEMKNESPIMEAIILEAWHFKVRSSNKRKYYDVIKRKNGTYSCLCRSFKYNDGDCKHVLAVKGM